MRYVPPVALWPALLCLPLLASHHTSARPTRSTSRSDAPSAFGAKAAPLKLPIAFEENRGQWPEKVRFSSRETGVVVDEQGILFQLPAAAKKRVPVRLRLSRQKPLIPRGGTKLPGRINYLIGNDPSRWVTDVPHYDTVTCDDVFPGIGLVVHASSKGDVPEYDFIVKPRADTAVIRYRLEGASSTRLDANGDLVLKTQHGLLRHRRPYCYQEVGGTRIQVAANFELKPDGEIGFQLGDHDPSRKLVIDPVVVWDAYIRAASTGNLSLDRDPEGNLYFAGGVTLQDGIVAPVPGTPGSYEPFKVGGNSDCFVGSLSPDGSQLRYLTYLGGTGDEGTGGDRIDGPALAVSPRGEVWVTGSTKSPDFPVTPASAIQPTKPGIGSDLMGGTLYNYDAFVAQLSSNGSSLLYGTYLGGTGDLPREINGHEYGVGIGVRQVPEGIEGDDIDEVFVVGTTSSTLFPTTGVGVFRHLDPNVVRAGNGDVLSNNSDVFIVKLGAGGAMMKSTYAGATSAINRDDMGNEIGRFAAVGATATAMALEDRGDVYITGYTNSDGKFYDPPVTFPVGGNAVQTTAQGGFDGFAIVFDNDLRDFYYSTLLGGMGHDYPASIAIDHAGRWAVGGETASNNYPTSNAPYPTFLGGPTDGFVTAFDGDFTVAYSTYLGGNQSDQVRAVGMTRQGQLSVAGICPTGGIPRVDELPQTTTVGSGFLTTFNTTGSIIRSSYLSGVGSTGRALGTTSPYAVLPIDAENLLVAGYASQSGAMKSQQRYTYPDSNPPSPLFIARIGSGPPQAPTDLNATSASSSRIDLQWTDNSSNETNFRVEYRKIGAASFTELSPIPVNQTTAQVTGLEAGKTYEFRVRAFNGLFSSYSNSDTAATKRPGKIQVSARTVDFGTVPRRRLPERKILRIKNVGNGVLNFTVGALETPFSVPPGPGTLNPNKVLAVAIEMGDAPAGTYRKTLTMTSDDPSAPTVRIVVKGRVR